MTEHGSASMAHQGAGPAAAGALDGVRIIDMTTVTMGPTATQMLGDMGADVIKVESPQGDASRWIGEARHPGMAAGFLQMNRSKRSIVLDLKHPDGRAALLKLVADADVLVYNVRPQAMARLGLTWAELQLLNPRLIHVGAFGYGQAGPYAAMPAYDDLIQGAVGLPSLVAQVGDGVPRYVPLTVMDRPVGLAMVGAVCAALYRREKTGKGQAIELPMFEHMAAFVLGDHMNGLTFDPPMPEVGNARLLARSRRPFQTADGYVCALLYNDKHWRGFFNAIGMPEQFERDPRVANISVRTEHAQELNEMLAQHFLTRTTAQWLRLLADADIPAMPLRTLESLMDDEHLRAVGQICRIEHPSEGTIRVVGPASTWSESPPAVRRHPPRLGEHSEELLREAGYGDDAIRRLLAAGITRGA